LSLREKLIRNSTIDLTASLQDSLVFDKKDSITTKVPMINVALSGTVDGGITPGLTMLAGPSKHFKSGFALLMISAFLKKYPDGVVLFYDSEFGTPKSYFETFNISMNAVIHTPITDIEELKFDIMKQLKELTRDDKVMIVIDSIGNLASKKEVDDALDQKAVADMSRAKQLKSLFRMISPHLTLKNIPLIVVNHVYSEIGLYPKMIVGGGCVVKGTNIITNNGLVSIENLNVGNLVKTLDGLKLITHIWNPETLSDGTPECYEIEFEDGYIVTCSNNHKFIIDNKWITAENLSIGDDVNVCTWKY
jgi:RecA/RadA recombinase